MADIELKVGRTYRGRTPGDRKIIWISSCGSFIQYRASSGKLCPSIDRNRFLSWVTEEVRKS